MNANGNNLVTAPDLRCVTQLKNQEVNRLETTVSKVCVRKSSLKQKQHSLNRVARIAMYRDQVPILGLKLRLNKNIENRNSTRKLAWPISKQNQQL